MGPVRFCVTTQLFLSIVWKTSGDQGVFPSFNLFSEIKNHSIDPVHKEMESTKMETANSAYKTDF